MIKARGRQTAHKSSISIISGGLRYTTIYTSLAFAKLDQLELGISLFTRFLLLSKFLFANRNTMN